MPRKTLVRTADRPYHITNRSNNRDYFYLEKSELWQIFMNCYEQLIQQYQCELHAFVLMSNHYHLIISTPNCNIGEAMKYLHREVARQANQQSKRTNHFFGGRYKWSLIAQENYYWTAIRYVFRNPVRAGICNSVTDYPYSSLNRASPSFQWQLANFFTDRQQIVELDTDWLNQCIDHEAEQAVKKALRRREFEAPRQKCGHRPTYDTARFKKGTATLANLSPV